MKNSEAMIRLPSGGEIAKCVVERVTEWLATEDDAELLMKLSDDDKMYLINEWRIFDERNEQQ